MGGKGTSANRSPGYRSLGYNDDGERIATGWRYLETSPPQYLKKKHSKRP